MGIGDTRVIDPIEERDSHPHDLPSPPPPRQFRDLLGRIEPEACSYVIRAAYPLLADQTEKIRVIKEIRVQTGWGLKDSKDFADFLMGGYGIEAGNRCQKALVAKAVLWASDPRARDRVPPDRIEAAILAADFVMGLAEDMDILPAELAPREKAAPAREDGKVAIWVVVGLRVAERIGTDAVTPQVMGAFLTEDKAVAFMGGRTGMWLQQVYV
jgi:hypothetical protein